jgi:hypothetical protein
LQEKELANNSFKNLNNNCKPKKENQLAWNNMQHKKLKSIKGQ